MNFPKELCNAFANEEELTRSEWQTIIEYCEWAHANIFVRDQKIGELAKECNKWQSARWIIAKLMQEAENPEEFQEFKKALLVILS